jgi:DNA polymerase-3 subunit alpha
MLDGASRIGDLISFAKDQGMPGLALTDHGVMYGAVKFYKEAKDAGIKPLMGCEVYVTADRHDRSRAPYYHLTLIARTAEGYRNLMKLSTCGFLEGFYYKPRVDMEMLRKYGRGIICLSGCLSAEVPTRILEGRPDEARRLLLEYAQIFDDVYLELQDDSGASTMVFSDSTKRPAFRLSQPMIRTTPRGTTQGCTTCCFASGRASSTTTPTG